MEIRTGKKVHTVGTAIRPSQVMQPVMRHWATDSRSLPPCAVARWRTQGMRAVAGRRAAVCGQSRRRTCLGT